MNKPSPHKSDHYILRHSQFMTALDLLSLFISLYVSNSIVHNVVFGTILFIFGYVVQNSLFLRKHWRGNLKSLMILFGAVIALMLIFGTLLFYFYPSLGGEAGSIVVLSVVVLLFLRSTATLSFIHRQKRRLRCTCWIMAVNVLFSLALLLITGWTVHWRFAFEIGMISVIYPLGLSVWLFITRKESLVFKAENNVGRIASYRLYNALLICSTVSLNLSVMTYISMLVLMPSQKDLYFPIALWIGIAIISTVILGRILKRGALKNLEKSSLFLVGGLLWLFSYFQLNGSFVIYDASKAWFWSLIQGVGLALMMLLSTYMQDDMKLVLELTDNASLLTVKANRTIVQQASFLISGILIFFELCFATFSLGGYIPYIRDVESFGKSFLWVSNLLPAGFVLLSIFFALVQPVNRDIIRKLKLYLEQKASNKVDSAFENRLRSILVKRYRLRFGVKILSVLLKPWFYHKVKNADYVDLRQGPAVFIVNHREIYGPIITQLYIPFSFRPWIEHKMLERQEIVSHIWEGTFRNFKPAWLAGFFLKLIIPLLLRVLNSVEPIPVYRGTREILKTINMSVEALMERDNVLIFPENPFTTSNKKYMVSGVSNFYTGFVHIAKAYYKMSGRIVMFYPVYADPHKRTIIFGKGITYDPDGRNEPERICDLLVEAMNRMAQL